MIENQANAILRQYWDGMLPVNVHAIAERMGAPVTYANLEGISGIVEMKDGRPSICVHATDAQVRQRFTVAHEIGHIALGHLNGSQTLFRDTSENYSSGTSDWLEQSANQFAAALLMPVGVLQYVIQSGHAMDLDALAKTFNVSTTAMGFRVRKLGLFNAI